MSLGRDICCVFMRDATLRGKFTVPSLSPSDTRVKMTGISAQRTTVMMKGMSKKKIKVCLDTNISHTKYMGLVKK